MFLDSVWCSTGEDAMAFKGWEKVAIRSAQGEAVEAVAPVIVSASRRTDIPALYSPWFFERLRAGHLKWTNPFSGTPQYVSFARTRAVVFWTKNPRPILPLLAELERRGIGYYFQFTLNDYEVESLEPGVPPVAERIATFRELSQAIGKERVVWRYDPLLLADGLDVDRLVERVVQVGERVHPFAEKLVFAFADIERYAKVRSRLRRFDAGCRELTPDEMRSFAEKLADAASGWGIQIATCAEAIDLAHCGIGRNKCIDDSLLARLFGHDPELMRFLGHEERRHRLKDTGQRRECGCIVSKDIGTYDTCLHLCRYCYANSSKTSIRSDQSRGTFVCPSAT
jgi:DNA repair photolyase